MSQPLMYLCIFLPTIAAGLIQATTGFGFGIFVLLFFPLFMPLLQSTALSSMICLGLNIAMFLKYRQYTEYKKAIVPAVFYCTVSAICIKLSTGLDMGKLKAFFGLFLVVIAFYFIFISGKLKIKATPLSGMICGSISGMASGLFGIGGPPMVIYWLAAAGDDKKKYLGCTQFFFMMTCIYTTIVRIANGIITSELIPLLIPGIAGMLIGKTIGGKIVDRIDISLMKKLIYIFLAVSGIITFIKNI